MAAPYAPVRTSEDRDDSHDIERTGDDAVTNEANDHSPLLSRIKSRSSSLSSHGSEWRRRLAIATGARGTFVGSTVNLANTILGTGMLAMPNAVSAGGSIPGALMIAFSGFTSSLGLWFLSRCASKTEGRDSSFFALSQLAFPQSSIGLFFDAAIAIKCFGVACSYLIIIGGLMPKVVASFAHQDAHLSAEVPSGILYERQLWITLSMIPLVPLGFLRKLDSLKYTSYVALVAVVYLLVVVIFKFFDRAGLPEPGETHLFLLKSNFVMSLPIYVFAFTAAQNLFPVYNELEDNSQKNMNRVIGTSIGSAATIYEAVGLLGYYTFGADVGSNIVEGYPNTIFISICRAFIVVFVLFSYPLQLHPCRASIDKIVRHFRPPTESPYTPTSTAVFVLMTTCILVTTYAVSMAVSSLDLVLAFVGSTGSVTISFILPAAFYLKMFRKKDERTRILTRGLAWFLFIYGITIFVVCFTLNVIKAVRGAKGQAPEVAQ